MAKTKKEKGKEGEEQAALYLQKKGYTILHTNFFYEHGEVDIIARQGSNVVFVEVKLRETTDYGDPMDFVKPAQIKKIVNVADYYMQEFTSDSDEARFDIIAIVEKDKSLEHIEDAFYHF